jgi:hypothetical protein
MAGTEDLAPLTEDELLAGCGAALARVERYGKRAVVQITAEETEALLLYVVSTGGVAACRNAFHARQGAAVEAARAAGGAL